jgi:hypothetical protein
MARCAHVNDDSLLLAVAEVSVCLQTSSGSENMHASKKIHGGDRLS